MYVRVLFEQRNRLLFRLIASPHSKQINLGLLLGTQVGPLHSSP